MFCFIHIEKAAGSTIHNLLKYNLPNYISLYPWYYWSNEPNAVFTCKEFTVLQKFFPFISGIGGHTLRPYLGYEKVTKRELLFFTFFREPISRYLSDFHYQNEKMGFERTIDEYIEESKSNNFMTVRIAGQENVNKAKKIISKKMDFIGLTEEFDKSLILLNKRLFNNKLDMRYEKQNVSNKNNVIDINDLTIEQKKRIYKNNEMDIELYSFAKKCFVAQIKNYGGNLSQDEKLFKETLKNFEYKKIRASLIKFYKGYNRYIAEPFAHRLR